MKKGRRLIRFGVAAVGAALVVPLLWPSHDPLVQFDICFEEDFPGAGDRYVIYTPVRCSNRGVRLGEAIGADYGELKFDDLNGDGVSEVIVESSRFRCSFAGYCGASREVVKVDLTNPPKFTQIERTRKDKGHFRVAGGRGGGRWWPKGVAGGLPTRGKGGGNGIWGIRAPFSAASRTAWGLTFLTTQRGHAMPPCRW